MVPRPVATFMISRCALAFIGETSYQGERKTPYDSTSSARMPIIPNALSAQLLVEATETNPKDHHTTNGQARHMG